DDEHIDEIHRDFVARAVGRGVGTGEAERVWKEVVAFASFGFCKAHAAAFAVPTYQSAWLKAHYPAHFLAGVLTHEPGMYPRRLILEDARHHGIAVLPLDVNLSEPDYMVEVLSSPTALSEVVKTPPLSRPRWSGPTAPATGSIAPSGSAPPPRFLRGSPDHRLPLDGRDGHRGIVNDALG